MKKLLAFLFSIILMLSVVSYSVGEPVSYDDAVALMPRAVESLSTDPAASGIVKLDDGFVGDGMLFEGEQAPADPIASYDPSRGPVISDNADDWDSVFTLYQLDPDSGAVVKVFDCQQSLQNTTLFRSKCIKGAYARQHFNKDLSKYAVTWYDTVTDSNHVGWIDKYGNLTDVSEQYHVDSGNFYAPKVDDIGAIFTPEDYLLFKDNSAGDWIWYNTAKACSVNVNSSWAPGDMVFYYLPSRTWIIWQEGWGFNYNALYGDPAFSFKLNDNTYYLHYEGRAETHDLYDGDIIIGIKDGTLVAMGPGVSQTVDEGYGSGYSTKKCVPITSESSYTITGCACRDGQIAFSATRGNENYLFLMHGLDSSAGIERIGKLPPGYRVLFW